MEVNPVWKSDNTDHLTTDWDEWMAVFIELWYLANQGRLEEEKGAFVTATRSRKERGDQRSQTAG